MKCPGLLVGVCAVLLSATCRAQAEVVIIPTLESDHQFDLNYTVAHLMALLDAVSPDAIVASDFTDWLRATCPWQAILPENHVASVYARERSLPIFGMFRGPQPYQPEAAEKSSQEFNERNSDTEYLRARYRSRLDTAAAGIARNYTSGGRSPEEVVRMIHAKPRPTELRDRFAVPGAQVPPAMLQTFGDEIIRLTASNQRYRRWAILQRWEDAVAMEDILRASHSVRVVPVDRFLPLKTRAVERRMDYRNTAWILSGVLDEWFGMWTPQAISGERIRALMTRLKKLAPENDPVTRFLEARWLMQNRDYGAAEPILQRLVATAGNAKFPFPINGKWIRPPWSSVRDKSKLNLAFVYDYRGDRDKALVLYRELLAQGTRLNEEAYATGYSFDDIRWVIEDYIRSPYTGLPEEAFRHFRTIAGMPNCAPGAAR